MGYQIVKDYSQDKDVVLKYLDSEKTVYLNSMYSPLREVQRFLKQNAIQKKFYILIGTGNGTLIKELIKYHSDFIFLYIIEPFSEIELSVSIKESINSHENIQYVNQKDYSKLSFVAILQKMIGIEVEILIHPNYDRTNPQMIKELIASLNQGVLLTRMNKNTQQFFIKEWILEPLFNLEYSMGLSHINEIKDKFKGETAILAASGPSLKNDMDFIKSNRKNAYIFAAGSAFNGLLASGINPDFVTCIDSSIRNFDVHFKDSTYKGPLITAGTINSNILKNHKGSVFLTDCVYDNVTRRKIKGIQAFSPVPSVAVFTLQVIWYLGFSKVYFVGQDLSLDSNNQYYADGVKSFAQVEGKKPDLYIENNIGEQIGTLFPLYSFLESFNDLIKLFDEEEIKLFNLSKYGAKIKGVPYIDKTTIQLKTRKNIDLPETFVMSSNEGLMAIEDTLNEFKELKNEVRKFKRVLDSMIGESNTSGEIKKVLKGFIKIREHKILEEVITPQISFQVQKINNIFTYHFEEQIMLDNKIKAEMISEIKKFIFHVYNFLDVLILDPRLRKKELDCKS
jgi:hypothetical protein